MKETDFYAILIALGERVKQLRKKKNYTLVKLDVETGISAPDLSKLESGLPDQNPQLYTLFRIARALDVKIEDLFKPDHM